MEFLKNQIARLQAQFAQLTASQKMLSVSLVAIMVMTLLWWGRYAGTAEMESLTDQDLPAEEVARLTSDLRGRGITVSSNGGKILVSADRKNEALGVLLYSDSLSHDTSSTVLLDIMSKSTNAFSTSQFTDITYNAAREAMLASIIRGFPGVTHAAVVIGTPQHVRFNDDASATATVYIRTRKGDKADKRLPLAAADVLVGAQPTLKRSGVHVIVDGVPQNLPDEGADSSFSGSTGLDLQAGWESYYTNVAQKALAICDGAIVTVSVTMDTSISDTDSTQLDAKGIVVKEKENMSEKVTTSGPGPSGEPGVNSNSGANQPMSIGSSSDGGGAGGSSTDKSSSKKEVFIPQQTNVKTHKPGGHGTPHSASVMMPRSFFVKSFKAETQSEKDPTSALLDPYINEKAEKYKSYVMKALSLASPTDVELVTFADQLPSITDMPAQAGGAVSMLLTGHAKEIALGALAVVSLFMVSMMVRKSGGSPALAGVGGGSALADGQGGAGSTVDALLAKATGKAVSVVEGPTEVGEGGQMLDGVELDDDSVKSVQVAEQVASLVKGDPDAAANLIKKWMNRV